MSYKEVKCKFISGDKVALTTNMAKSLGDSVGIFSEGHTFIVKGMYPAGRPNGTLFAGVMYPSDDKDNKIDWVYNLLDAEADDLPMNKRHFVSCVGKYLKLVSKAGEKTLPDTEKAKSVKGTRKSKITKVEVKSAGFGFKFKKD